MSFKKVCDSCFGVKIKSDDYQIDIQEFALTYLKLIDYCKPLGITLNVIVKVHDTFVHVPWFLNMLKEKGFGGLGMGFFSEQTMETGRHSHIMWTEMGEGDLPKVHIIQ